MEFEHVLFERARAHTHRKYCPLAYLYERLYGFEPRKLMIMSETPAEEEKKNHIHSNHSRIKTIHTTKWNQQHEMRIENKKKNLPAAALGTNVQSNQFEMREWLESNPTFRVDVDYFWLLYLLLCINSPVKLNKRNRRCVRVIMNLLLERSKFLIHCFGFSASLFYLHLTLFPDTVLTLAFFLFLWSHILFHCCVSITPAIRFNHEVVT